MEEGLRDVKHFATTKDVVWLHVRATSGLTEQEANGAELNCYLQAQEYSQDTAA